MPEMLKGFGTLTPLQKEFIEILASLPDKDEFYLAGGTALAEYYLGHRLSFDLDFFTYSDLRADKLLAYFGRAEPRDAVDLYFILQKESPEVLLEQATQKDPGFDLYFFAIALNRKEIIGVGPDP
jgi:hypothetical protein